MTDQRMAQVSLSAFRERITSYGQPVEVSRRDGAGGIQVLGYWTPYMTFDAGAEPLPRAPGAPLELPVYDDPDEPTPVIIGSQWDVAAVVKPDPVRAVPKPSQRKRSKP